MRPLLAPALIIAAAVAAYANSLDVPLQFDDLPNIVDEPRVHATSLAPDELAAAADGFPLNRWLARVSFAANHAVHGVRPTGYHVLNLLFHVTAALLVLAVGRRLLDALAADPDRRDALRLPDAAGRRRAAAIAALLFAVHPVHTQAVTYVVQRMTSMGACFALAALWLWNFGAGGTAPPAPPGSAPGQPHPAAPPLAASALGAGGTGPPAPPGSAPGQPHPAAPPLVAPSPRGRAARVARLAGAVGLWWLAVSCKENYAVLPGLALLVEWVIAPDLGARLRARWRAWAAAAVAVAAAGAALAARLAPVLEKEAARYDVTAGERLLSQGRILWHYLSLLALPLPGRLHVDYAYPPSRALLDPPATLPGLLGLAALVAAAAWARRRAPLVTLAVGWFLVALVVEQTVLPIDLVFEQRIYFAGIGLLLLAAAALVRFVRVPRIGAWAVAAPLAAALAAGTWARNARWEDPALLYADAEGSGPGAVRGLLNVGAAHRQRGELDQAERVLRRAIALSPGEAGAYVNLGNVELDRGRLAEAERWYREALARDAHLADVWFNLGILLTRRGERRGAADAYEAALRLQPAHSGARTNLALLQAAAGDVARALATLDEALRIDPGALTALANRAALRARQGDDAGATADAERAVAMARDRALPWVVLSQVHLAAGRTGPARAAAAEALRLEPGNADARALLARTPPGP
jgi:tetratricopeptide (TPR) repeat protein